jgi:predicted MFS family arabinose efflux permease
MCVVCVCVCVCVNINIFSPLSSTFCLAAFFLSLQGSLVGFLLFAFAANFTMLLCVRFVAGLFGGSAVIGNAYITDVYEPHERGPMFARMVGGASLL